MQRGLDPTLGLCWFRVAGLGFLVLVMIGEDAGFAVEGSGPVVSDLQFPNLGQLES